MFEIENQPKMMDLAHVSLGNLILPSGTNIRT